MHPQPKAHKWETHLHTAEASACAVTSGAEMVRVHQAAGYEGIVVTDHFFNGNTAVPANLHWHERVTLFCKGYENALREASRMGMHVLFGLEFGYHATEFLTFGLTPEFLHDHPGMAAWSPEVFFKEVHRAGGYVSHAHPFREASYIPHIRLYPEGVDAVEIRNASHMNPEWDRKALAYAREHGLAMTAGSDSHDANRLFGGGMVFHQAIGSAEELIQAIRNNAWEIPESTET